MLCHCYLCFVVTSRYRYRHRYRCSCYYNNITLHIPFAFFYSSLIRFVPVVATYLLFIPVLLRINNNGEIVRGNKTLT